MGEIVPDRAAIILATFSKPGEPCQAENGGCGVAFQDKKSPPVLALSECPRAREKL